jgi:hypothetical protein
LERTKVDYGIYCHEEDFVVGLAERRAFHRFQTEELPVLQGRVDQAAGHNVEVEAEWDKLAPEGESHLYAESWKKIYFEPLIAALKRMAEDDMSREALRTGLHKVVICNASGNYYPDRWAKFEGAYSPSIMSRSRTPQMSSRAPRS